MKLTTLVFLTTAILVGGSALAARSTTAASSPQTTCPVTGNPIDKAVHIAYQGQRIYFCCSDCPAKLEADPEKYFAKLAADHVALENVQTTCPVSGEKLEGGDMGEPVSISYHGRTVRFCCKMCVSKFEKEPAKYLAKLPGKQPVSK